ncbi:hypothetical protein ACF1HJ_28240 [Streptomyces sp. NPDC013978]|uniref:hypothetical protein n=1 Tax=Streptomyces sp. NPDC013978 TaxID=3364869 RepID=UPI0036F6DFE5
MSRPIAPLGRLRGAPGPTRRARSRRQRTGRGERWYRGAVPGWSSEFDAWAADSLARGDIGELSAYATRAPGMPYAHPTPDHFLPIFITLGSADTPEQPARTTIDGFMIGFAKRSFALG